jgi:hypothetical protein
MGISGSTGSSNLRDEDPERDDIAVVETDINSSAEMRIRDGMI